MSKGIVNIHGREYKTVALRIHEFRHDFPIQDGWGLHSEILVDTPESVCVRASIVDPGGKLVACGHASETVGSSKINRDAAMENCETSAWGRALAAAGYGGEHIASADEMQKAAPREEEPPPPEPHWLDRMAATGWSPQEVDELCDAQGAPLPVEMTDERRESLIDYLTKNPKKESAS